MLKTFLKIFREIAYNESYSSIDGFIQGIDPRVKFCSSLVFILLAIMVKTITPLIILLCVIFGLSFSSKISLKYFTLRTILLPGFVAIIALPLPFMTPGTTITIIGYNEFLVNITIEGVYKAVQVTLRVWACVATSILLVLTTKFSSLVHVMEKIKIPKVFVMMLSVTHRFIFLFLNESYRMVLAKEARTVKKESRLESMKTLANMITTLFIRAYERGERVYLAMMARGYKGHIKSLSKMKISKNDIIFGSIIILISITILSIEYLYIGIV
ncbi:MAG: cobalt ECF transporter T component CbiQ [Candidatus Methylarchaceae archaeon HK02M2]|nr:cobalt ECF transporter T component CbiQ [Candidatus Methylarchaceae archaeon HK02M2]